MSEGRVDITIMENPGVFIQELRDALTIDVLLDGMLGINVASELVSDHGNLSGLGDDDHLQYFDQTRGDIRYERHLGAPPADDYILSSKANGTRSWIIPPAGGEGTGVEYHNLLLGIQGGAVDEYYHFSAALYNAFEYVGGATPYLRIKIPVACDENIVAYADTGWLPPDIWESMPYASASVRGGIQFTGAFPAVKYLREDGAWEIPAGEGGGEMVYPGAGIARSTGTGWAASITDNSAAWNEAVTWMNTHGANAVAAYGWGDHALEGYLTGITNSMVSAVLDADLNAIAAISGTSGLLRKTNVNTWSLDTATYLTVITKAMVEGVLTGSITSHTHPSISTGNFSVSEESGRLVFKYGSTVIASISSAGYLKTLDEIESKTTP